MRINPIITALGLLGLFAASMLVGYLGGQAFLAPAKSASRPARTTPPTPLAVETPVQSPAPPLGTTRQSAVSPSVSSAPSALQTQKVPAQAAPAQPASSTPSAPAAPGKPVASTVHSKPVTAYRVQVGAYRRRENAEARIEQLKRDGYDPYIVTSGDLYRVIAGAFADRENAVRLQEELHARGYEVLVLPVH